MKKRAVSTLDKYVRDVRSFRIWCNGRKIEKALVLEYKQLLSNFDNKKQPPTD